MREKKSEWQTVKAIMAASSGNLVEWFDFYIYAFFSVYFADQFFVADNPTLSLMQAAGVFFVGFLMRPIGGYIFGRAADRIGPQELDAHLDPAHVRRLPDAWRSAAHERDRRLLGRDPAAASCA
jgi:MFS family permease